VYGSAFLFDRQFLTRGFTRMQFAFSGIQLPVPGKIGLGVLRGGGEREKPDETSAACDSVTHAGTLLSGRP
jgi:hypothetical protein